MNSSVIPVAIIDPDAPAGSLEQKQPDVDNGVEVHGKEGYFSKDYAELEWEISGAKRGSSQVCRQICPI